MGDPISELLRGRYELIRPLGRNNASTTWEARDVRTEETCVVKELSVGEVVRTATGAESFDPADFTKLIELFEREARVLAHLDHPGIPRFIEHFRIDVDGDERLYTVQEFVPGQTLEAAIRSGRHFTEDEAAEMCRELADILGHLHGRSPPLVHRDVKPSNIILGEDNRVRLVDFGSVRNLLGSEGGKTIVGTYGYMPIEQYEGRAVPQSDFYGLGMSLIYLLSHTDPTKIPRTGMSLEFREYVQVSERFARLLAWLIEASPDDRPPNAQAILDSLAPGLRTLPDLLPPSTPARREGASGTSLQTRKTVTAVAALLLLLLGFLGFFLTSGPLFLQVDDAPVERQLPPPEGGVNR